MTNTPRLSRSGIEYLTHEWGFFSGCHHKQLGVCPAEFNCWAETITRRFKGHYANGFEPTFYPEAFLSPLHLKKPARIGCAFMGDLFMDEISPDLNLAAVELASSTDGKTHLNLPNVPLRKAIFTTVGLCPQHTFVFLTKNPKGLLKWSPFPDNCWAGFSACNRDMLPIKPVPRSSLRIILLHCWPWAVKYRSGQLIPTAVITVTRSMGTLTINYDRRCRHEPDQLH